jgi:hypothetical protein
MRDAIYSTSAEVRQTEDENEIRQKLREAIREYTPTDGEIEEYLKANGMSVLGSWQFRTTLTLVSIEEERRGPWRMELDNLHVEHIAPRRTYEKPEYREWREKLDDDRFEQQKNLIGNLTLLLDGDHASIEETSFASKKRTYRDSDVKIAEDVARYDDWTSEDIDERTREMTDELIERWSL